MDRKIVTEIPANPMLANLQHRKRKLRVAAYCRVSTEEEEQQNSFEVQVDYYTEKISNHEGWQLAGIFADDGISGVRTKKREQFNKMIELCKQKKIDLILTKSISRFARNTLDCIKHIRILKSWGIPVIFEKENIDTSNMNSEMILTCLSAFAQAESESISGNVTKGIRMGYKQGRFTFRYTGFAFQRGPDGEKLEKAGIPSPAGEPQWTTQTVLRILQNEKYAGDVLLQKTYTSDFLEGKVKKNNGELPQYYIQNNHPAIIPRETFYQIQEELARRRSKKPSSVKKTKTNRGRYTSKYALSERLVCGDCGCYFRRVTWSIHGRKQIVWRCINRLEFGPKACKNSPSLKETALQASILDAIRSLIYGQQEEMAAVLQDTLIRCIAEEDDESNPAVIESQIKELESEFDRLLIFAVNENDIVDQKLKQVSESILHLKQKKKQIEYSTEHSKVMEAKSKEVMALISAEDLNLTEYSDTLVYRIVEKVTVLSSEEIKIRFIGGFEITQPLY